MLNVFGYFSSGQLWYYSGVWRYFNLIWRGWKFLAYAQSQLSPNEEINH